MEVATAVMGAGLAILAIILAVVLLRQSGLSADNALLREAASSFWKEQLQTKGNHDAEVAELLDRLADANETIATLALKSPDAAGSYLERVLSRQKQRDDSRREGADLVPRPDDDGSTTA